MKAKEACKHYNITFDTLRAWAKSGKIPVTVLPSGRMNYLPTKAFIKIETEIKNDNSEN